MGSTRLFSCALALLASLSAASVSLAQTPQPAPAPTSSVTLRQAVDQAIARNPSAVIAQTEIRRTEALVREARSSSLPTLYANATYTRLDADRKFSNRVVAAADQFNANLSLQVPLVAPQRWMNWSHAADAVDLSRANAADIKRQVALAAARTYLAVVSQRRIVEVSERARATAKSHHEFASAQVQGGIGTRIDQVRAEQEYAVADAQVHGAYVGLLRSQEALGVILGAPGPVDAAEEPTLPQAPTSEQEVQAGVAARPDIQALRTRVRNSQHLVKDSWADYMPSLIGAFQPFYQNPSTMTMPTTGWQAQLIMSVPLYDGGMRYGLADERDAVAAQSRAQLDAALRQARSDVRAAAEAVRRTEDALRASKSSARLAQEALDLANQAYKAGATTNLEVIDSERRARDASTQAAIAEDQARQARLELLSTIGRFP